MGTDRNRRGISAVIIAVLLITVIVALVLLAFVFLTGMSTLLGGPTQSSNNTGLQVVITPSIYSSDAQIGMVGERANFTVILSNTVSNVQVGRVDLESSIRVEQNVTFALTNGETKTVVISQPLTQTGPWILSVVTNGVEAGSYTFNVVRGPSEASYQVNQYETTKFYRNLTFITFFISLIGFAIAVAALVRPARTIKIATQEDGFAASPQ